MDRTSRLAYVEDVDVDGQVISNTRRGTGKLRSDRKVPVKDEVGYSDDSKRASRKAILPPPRVDREAKRVVEQGSSSAGKHALWEPQVPPIPIQRKKLPTATTEAEPWRGDADAGYFTDAPPLTNKYRPTAAAKKTGISFGPSQSYDNEHLQLDKLQRRFHLPKIQPPAREAIPRGLHHFATVDTALDQDDLDSVFNFSAKDDLDDTPLPPYPSYIPFAQGYRKRNIHEEYGFPTEPSHTVDAIDEPNFLRLERLTLQHREAMFRLECSDREHMYHMRLQSIERRHKHELDHQFKIEVIRLESQERREKGQEGKQAQPIDKLEHFLQQNLSSIKDPNRTSRPEKDSAAKYEELVAFRPRNPQEDTPPHLAHNYTLSLNENLNPFLPQAARPLSPEYGGHMNYSRKALKTVTIGRQSAATKRLPEPALRLEANSEGKLDWENLASHEESESESGVVSRDIYGNIFDSENESSIAPSTPESSVLELNAPLRTPKNGPEIMKKILRRFCVAQAQPWASSDGSGSISGPPTNDSVSNTSRENPAEAGAGRNAARNGKRSPKRRRLVGDGGTSTDEDGNESSRSRSGPSRRGKSKKEVMEEVLLACPFRKHNPLKYKLGTHRTCASGHWGTMARVKEHIYRAHKLIVCIRCQQEFSTQKLFEAHQRAEVACERRPETIHEGITQEQERRLKSRKAAHQSKNVAEQWSNAYRILFPGEEPPSPYYEEFDGYAYQVFLGQELPTVLSTELHRALQVSQQRGEQLGQIVLDNVSAVVRASLESVFRSFYSVSVLGTEDEDALSTTPRSPTVLTDSCVDSQGAALLVTSHGRHGDRSQDESLFMWLPGQERAKGSSPGGVNLSFFDGVDGTTCFCIPACIGPCNQWDFSPQAWGMGSRETE